MRAPNPSRLLPWLAAAALVVLGGCGENEPAPAKKPAPAPAPAPVAVEDDFGGGGGGGGGMSSARVPAGAEDEEREALGEKLAFKVVPAAYKFAPRDKVPCTFLLQNVGGMPVHVIDPDFDLAHNFEVRVKAGERDVVFRQKMPRPRDGKVGVRLLEPGELATVQVDLGEMLSMSPSGNGGDVEFTVHYRGSAQLAKDTPNLWNPDGSQELSSDEIRIEFTRPEWISQFRPAPETNADGSTDERDDADDGIDAAIHNGLLSWNPDMPQADEALMKLLDQGEASIATLALLAEWMDHVDENKRETGSKAFSGLLTAGDPARAVLKKASETPHPARDMALKVLEFELLKRVGKTPKGAFEAVRSVAGGAETGTRLQVEIGAGGPTPSVYILDTDGTLTKSFSVDGTRKSVSRKLVSSQLVELKRGLIDSYVWCWEPVRTSRVGGENAVRVLVSDLNGAGVDVTLREEEARKTNPLAAKFVELLERLTSDMT